MRPYAKHIGVLCHEGWKIRELYNGEGDQPDQALIGLVQNVVKQELEHEFDDPISVGFYVLSVTEKHHSLVLAYWHHGADQVIILIAEKGAGDAKFKEWLEYPYPNMPDLITFGIEAALWEAHCTDGVLDVDTWANAPHALIA